MTTAGNGSCWSSIEVSAASHALELGRVERAGRVERRVAGGEQQPVALAQRDVERAREPHDHLRGWAASDRSRRSSRSAASSARRARGRAGSCRAPAASSAAGRRARAALSPRHAIGRTYGRPRPRPFPARELLRPRAGGCSCRSNPRKEQHRCSSPSTPPRLPPRLEADPRRHRRRPRLRAQHGRDRGRLPGAAQRVRRPAPRGRLGELDPVAREVAGVAVGVAVDNRYGVAFHSTVLGRLGVDEAEHRADARGRAAGGPELAAVVRRSRRRSCSTEARSTTTSLDAARQAGLGDRGDPRDRRRVHLRRPGRHPRQPRRPRRARRVPGPPGLELRGNVRPARCGSRAGSRGLTFSRAPASHSLTPTRRSER